MNPTDKTVTPVQLEPGDLQRMYELLNCSTITCAYLTDTVVVYVDDEGLFKPNSFMFHEPTDQFLAGNGLVLGTTPEGESDSCPISVDDLKSQFDFGTPLKTASSLLFIGDRNVREIK